MCLVCLELLFPPGPGGGGVLQEFLGGDVPLGPWNPLTYTGAS